METHCLRRALLAVAFAAAAASGGEPVDAEGRGTDVGDARVTIRSDGRWSMACGGKTAIPDARLVVAAPGWKGSASMADARSCQWQPSRAMGLNSLYGELVEPTSGVTWRYYFLLLSRPGSDDKCDISYSLEPLADTKVGEIAVFLDLPAEHWRGKQIVLWPQAEATFPEKRPPSRHFLSAVARRAVFRLSDDRHITLAFDKPTRCTVQDCREFDRDEYQLYVRVFGGGAVKRGQRLRLHFTLDPNDRSGQAMPSSDYSSKARLHAGAVALPRTTVPVYHRLEADLDVTGTWTTPFDADQIRVDAVVTTPSGRQLTVPCFYHQEFELLREDDEAWLEPRAARGWKLRFAPTEVGKHAVALVARDKSGEAHSEPVDFDAVRSDDPGFIRVSGKDKRFFEFDSGQPYFAVGENVCTWRRGVHDYDDWFPALGKAGGNYARIWMWGHCFGVEWGKPGHYRMDHAAALDRAMELAERHGIRVKLCLEAWRGFEGRKCFVKPGVLHPYSKKNGGPCAKEMDVFTDPEAKRMFRNRLRYCVARWGCSTHILAWEFWNEINCVFGYRGREQDVMDWTAEMARHLKQIDPWGHLVTNSLGSFQVDDRLWTIPDIDFAQVHGYWHPTGVSKEMGKDMAEFVPHWLGRIDHYGKPRLFAEYGLVNPRWGHSPRADEDTEGVHLHNGLWSSIMTGASGTAMLWWWGNYVHPNDLYFQFAAVAKFVEGVPWTTAGFQPVGAKASTPQLRVMGLRGKRLTLLWLQNRRHTWWNVVEKQPIPPIEGARVTVSGLENGDYDVQWWDTWKGGVARKEQRRAERGALTLDVGKLPRDAAAKLVAAHRK